MSLLSRGSRISCVVLAVVLVLGFAAVATACPSCKNSLAENDPAFGAMAAGYFYSILFMMAMPFVLLGSFGSYAYFAVRRAQNAQQEGDKADRADDLS